jgi:hypothetical protein
VTDGRCWSATNLPTKKETLPAWSLSAPISGAQTKAILETRRKAGIRPMGHYRSKRIMWHFDIQLMIREWHEEEDNGPKPRLHGANYSRTAEAVDAGLPRPEQATWPQILKARQQNAALRYGLDANASLRQIKETIRRRIVSRYEFPQDYTLMQIGCAFCEILGLDAENTNWYELRLEFLEYNALRLCKRHGLPPKDTLLSILKEGHVERKWRAFRAEILRRAVERQ